MTSDWVSPLNPESELVVSIRDLSQRFGRTLALDSIDLDLPAGYMVGLIGPDGVGKSSLLSIISGARAVQTGAVEVLGGDMASAAHREDVGPRVAYMPQGLGKNLYPVLSVFENVDFFGRLFGQGAAERKQRIAGLLEATNLAPFANRPAGKLSGGMKQKLGLCCALIHDPDLLILDEPTTGVDPLSRRQFWELIERIRLGRPGMSILAATAYMEEAASFDWLVAMNAGRVLAAGTERELLTETDTPNLESAIIALLPAEERADYRPVEMRPRPAGLEEDIAIEAHGLTKRFGDFVAVDHVSFRISRGEIFGFLGSNGSGKSTTMKMLTGLLPASEGQAWLFGHEVDPEDLDTRRRVGYMSQNFSLYSELTVRQNLVLHARLFEMPADVIPGRVEQIARRFDLVPIMDELPDSLPLGQRQRLSLAVAMIHDPDILILDEPTSGVDPVARDHFWQILIDLSRDDLVTIFISTHFMNEAERCDRISLMNAGRVLVSDTPADLVKRRGVKTLEEAFISYLEEAGAESEPEDTAIIPGALPGVPEHTAVRHRHFDPRRMLSYSLRESLELRRDPIRATMALAGSLILMLIIGYGINLDVEDLSFAVLDRDQSTISRNYTLGIAGSRYFVEKPPISDYAELDRRMRSGELSLAIEIPPGFGRDMERGNRAQIGAWIDGAMPQRAETVQSYVQGLHQHWLAQQAAERQSSGPATNLVTIETRFRYNPNLESIVAMVPGTIPLLLMMIPAMLTALSVVREKELGSIINFYVTPVTRVEFLLGKQIPYIILAMFNFLLLVGLGVFVLGVPLTGSFPTLLGATLIYVMASTGFGLLISSFMRSQIAAIFGTAILTMLPATQFSGMIDPVSSLQGVGAIIGKIYPTAHYLTISRGVFSKALSFSELRSSFVPLVIAVPVLLTLSVMLLRKQET